MLNQRQVSNLAFATVTAAEVAGRPGEVCFVAETWTVYEYVAAGSGHTVDHLAVLDTGNGGNTRWVGRAGKYQAEGIAYLKVLGDFLRGAGGNYDQIAVIAQLVGLATDGKESAVLIDNGSTTIAEALRLVGGDANGNWGRGYYIKYDKTNNQLHIGYNPEGNLKNSAGVAQDAYNIILSADGSAIIGGLTINETKSLSDKADKEVPATAGNLAKLNAAGNLEDSEVPSSTVEVEVVDNLPVMGTTGGYDRIVSEATAAIPAAASVDIAVDVPSGARLLGAQLRVDVALATGETWDAAYITGATQAIASAQAVAVNTKANKMFDENAATSITTDVTKIRITKNGGGDFTAQGTIRAIVYYEAFIAMGDVS